MLSDDTVKQLASTPVFISNCNKLAYQLGISHQDASQELLLELLDHRLRTWSDKDVTTAIAKESPVLGWKIKYAAKDYYRRVNKDYARELTKSQMMAGMEPHVSSHSETLEALEWLPELFKNKATKCWVESVLRVGQKETMVNFNQTPRRFGNKLAKVCKYARQHQQPKQSNSHNTKELHIISQWNDLMADPDTDDNGIQAFIDQHKEYIDSIIDDPRIAYQGRLLKDYVHAGKDKYVFADLMAKREQELKEK
ncbi:hypothetical protein KZR06_07230 [Lacticaseibacillus paracasei]|uniref:hypothetical protein n=1 Tax=Lacticaseibacillus paracasei TaxID=1597 RepID=UPI0021A95901|nr:hypothetical protein [Lacticaseibacillus paracasei]UWP75277.1 hypothetical protein KZR06_07230 [Lacticaseibacillus paracasei]